MTSPGQQQIRNLGLAPTNALESALLVSLQPGAYTAIVRGVNGTGIALAEVYDVDQSKPANAINLSSRSRVQTGDNVMIAGFALGGNQSRNIIVRALGPSLTAHGIAGALQNPTLELHNASGALIAFNDNWRSNQEAAIIATGLAPTNNNESAITGALAPGQLHRGRARREQLQRCWPRRSLPASALTSGGSLISIRSRRSRTPSFDRRWKCGTARLRRRRPGKHQSFLRHSRRAARE